MYGDVTQTGRVPTALGNVMMSRVFLATRVSWMVEWKKKAKYKIRTILKSAQWGWGDRCSNSSSRGRANSTWFISKNSISSALPINNDQVAQIIHLLQNSRSNIFQRNCPLKKNFFWCNHWYRCITPYDRRLVTL